MQQEIYQSKPIAYLGAPYSHPDSKLRSFRLRAVTQLAFDLFQQGRMIYSPLTHNIPIDYLGFHGDHRTWLEFDHSMLSRCNSLIVFKLPGWEESKGLKAELAKATEFKMPIEEIIPSDEFLERISRQGENDLLQSLQQAINQIAKERDWEQFHSPKNIAMSLQVEASEVAEHFIWLSEKQSSALPLQTKQAVLEELGDVFVNLLHLSDKLEVNLIDAALQSLEKIQKKYPADIWKGRQTKCNIV